MRKATMGKMIFSRCDTSRGGFMRISRSLTGGQKFHHWRLDDRHEGHVGIRSDGNGPEQVGSQLGREEDRRWPVGPADDADGPGLGRSKTQVERADQGQENARLRRSPQQHQPRAGEHGREIGHRADAEKDQRRKDPLADAKVDVVEHAAFVVHADGHAGDRREITHDAAEANRQQQ